MNPSFVSATATPTPTATTATMATAPTTTATATTASTVAATIPALFVTLRELSFSGQTWGDF